MISIQHLYSHLKTSDIKLYQALDALSLSINGISTSLESIRTGSLKWRLAPITHTSSGEQGDIAYDKQGNFYFCYDVNRWARIGEDGYTNVF